MMEERDYGQLKGSGSGQDGDRIASANACQKPAGNGRRLKREKRDTSEPGVEQVDQQPLPNSVSIDRIYRVAVIKGILLLILQYSLAKAKSCKHF